MSKLHIYIDGTWLFKVFNGSVFNRFIYSSRYFTIDFNRFNALLLKHIGKERPECTEIGNCYFVTSLFDLPNDFDTWVNKNIANPYGGQSVTISQDKVQRFGQLMRRLDGITQSSLTKQLRELEQDGFLHREIYKEIPPKVEYSLTELGQSFTPILNQMMIWGEAHLCPPDYINPFGEDRTLPE